MCNDHRAEGSKDDICTNDMTGAESKIPGDRYGR